MIKSPLAGRRAWFDALDAVPVSAEEEVVAVHSGLWDLFEGTGIAALLVDASYCVRKVTARARELFALYDSGAEGRHVGDVAMRLTGADLCAAIAGVLESRRAGTLQARVLGGRSYRIRILPDRPVDETGDAVVVTIVEDGDVRAAEEPWARQAAEREAERTRELLRLIIDAVPALVAYVDAEGRYLLANEEHRRWLGRNPDALIGKSIDAIAGASGALLPRHLAAEALRGLRVSHELEVDLGRGERRWAQADYLPDVAADGTVRGFVALVQDVTERERQKRKQEGADRREDERPATCARPGGELIGGAAARRVLVVEDDEDARDTLRMLLERWGHEVRVAPDGVSALVAVEAFRPDLVLLDIGLPTVNGYEVCRRLRRRPGGDELSIVALSGFGEEEVQGARGARFDAHLHKPASPEALRLLFERLSLGRPHRG